MRRISALAIVLALMLTPLLGMAEADARKRADTLIVGHTTMLNGNFFSELWGNNTADIDVRSLLHEYPLVAWTQGGEYRLNQTVVESLNRQEEPNGDVTYTVTLKPGLQYSDGSPIVARDYAFSFLLLSSPQVKQLTNLNADYAQIVGFEDYSSGAEAVFSGIRLLAERQFSVRIKAAYLPYFYELSYIHAYPYPITVLVPGCDVRDEGEGAYILGDMTAQSLRQTIMDPEKGYLSHPKVTSGPYRLLHYDAAQHTAEFEINPYYRGNYEGETPEIPRLFLREVRNQTMLAELEAGTVDLVNKVTDGSVINEALGKSAAVLAHVPYPRTGSGFLAVACERPIMSSTLTRRAIAHSLDPELLPRDFLKGYGERIYGYYGLGQWMPEAVGEGLETLPRYELDLKAATELLEDDGWTYDHRGQAYNTQVGGLRYRYYQGKLEPLSLIMGVLEENRAAQMLLDNLQKNLNSIGGEIVPVEMTLQNALRQYYRQDERGFDILFMGTNFTYLFDPTITYRIGDEYQGTANTSGLRDARLERLAAEVTRVPSGDREAFLRGWLAFQRYWAEVLPMIPLYSNTYYDLFEPALHNYHPDLYWNWGTAILYARLAR